MVDIVLSAENSLTGNISFSAPLYALLAAGFLLFFFKKLGLFKREGRIRQVVAASYCLYLPLVFCLCALAWTVAVSVESAVVSSMTDLRPSLTTLSVEGADNVWSRLKKDYEHTPAIDTKEFEQRAATDLMAEIFKDNSEIFQTAQLKAVVGHITHGVHARLAQRLEEDIAAAASRAGDAFDVDAVASGMAPGEDGFVTSDPGVSVDLGGIAGGQRDIPFLEAVWENDFAQHLQGGLVADIVVEQTRHLFTLFFKKIQLFFLLLTIPVLLEVGYALYQRPQLPDT